MGVRASTREWGVEGWDKSVYDTCQWPEPGQGSQLPGGWGKGEQDCHDASTTHVPLVLGGAVDQVEILLARTRGFGMILLIYQVLIFSIPKATDSIAKIQWLPYK